MFKYIYELLAPLPYRFLEIDTNLFYVHVETNTMKLLNSSTLTKHKIRHVIKPSLSKDFSTNAHPTLKFLTCSYELTDIDQ